MNKFHKDRMEKQIKCHHQKIKNVNTWIFTCGDKYGVLFRNNGDESAVVISTEKLFLRSRNPKHWKKIPFKDGIKKVVSIATKPNKFPVDAFGFASIMIDAINGKMAKIKPRKEKTFTRHTCKGG